MDSHRFSSATHHSESESLQLFFLTREHPVCKMHLEMWEKRQTEA